MKIQNRRRQQRYRFTEAVAICPVGISQVVDISSGGISVKCRCEKCLSKRWKIDILATTGIHLKDFSVEKVWESFENKRTYTPKFTTKLGVKFNSLSPKQRLALHHLISG